jgi:hypothetical protein
MKISRDVFFSGDLVGRASVVADRVPRTPELCQTADILAAHRAL